MKRKLLLFLMSVMLGFYANAQAPIITAIVDGDCSGGTPKVLEVYAQGTVDFSLYSLENQVNDGTSWGTTTDLSSLGTVTDDFVYVYYDGSAENFLSEFPSATGKASLDNSVMNLNGDDRIRIVLTATSGVIDQYGVDDVDGTGETWEYKDSYAKRNNATGPDAGFTEANWTFAGASALNGGGSCQGGDTFETMMGGIGTFSTSGGTITPTQLAITSVTPASPVVSTSFAVTVEAQDGTSAAGNVDQDTEVQINLASGSGTLSGTATGTITNGTSSIAIIGLSYDAIETMELNASVNSGMSLTASSNASVVVQGIPSITLPHAEDFADCGTIQWNAVSVASDKNWTCGSGYMDINAYGGDVASDDYLISDVIDFDSYTDEVMTFQSWTNYADASYPPIELLYSTDFSGDPSTATWNALTATFAPEDSETWTASGNVDLSAISGSAYIAFHYTSTGTGGNETSNWRIDDISIAENAMVTPTQLAITSVTPASPVVGTLFDVVVEAQDATGTAANVDQDTEVQINLAAKGVISGTVTGTITNGASSVTISGLSYDVAETIEINASVNSGMSLTTSANQTVVVQSLPVVALPYTRDFETGDLYTDGWTTQLVTGTLDWVYDDYSGDHFAKMTNYVSGSGNQASETWFISPAIDLSSATNVNFSFYNSCSSHSGADIEVYISSDYDGLSLPSTATWNALSPTLSTGSYDDVSSGDLDISAYVGANAYVAFKYIGTDSDGKTWQIDDISIAEEVVVTPTHLAITSVTPASPIVGTAFDIVVEAQDGAGVAGDVDQDTEVQINLATGTGAISGTVTGTIANGTSSVTISDLSYDVVETIELSASVNTGMALTASTNESIVIQDVTSTSIYDIQYTTDPSGDSPLVGQTVKTSGVVTAVKSDKSFFLQDGDGAWNGVFVYQNGATVLVGDSVTVTAEVVEYIGLTELSNITAITVLNSGNTLPNAAAIVTADMAEDYEGVLIAVADAKCVNADAGYKMWAVLNGANQDDSLLVDDDLYEYVPVLNNIYNVTGVGHYSYSAYKILPRDAADIADVTPGPQISNVAITPEVPAGTDAVSVSADIIDIAKTITTAKVFWGSASGTLDNEIAMSNTSGNTWATDTDIPAQVGGTNVYYMVWAENGLGEKDSTAELSYTVSVAPTQLAITSVSPASPVVGTNFSIVIEAQDGTGIAGNVDEDTEVQINLATGTGAISGTVTGTIANGTSTVTIAGLSYNTVETIEVNASVNSGMALTASANQSIVVTDLPDQDLFFSEYVESSTNKAIEIYNGNGVDADLSEYIIMQARNGYDWGEPDDNGIDSRYILPLNGTLANEEVFVISSVDSDQAILDVADLVLTYESNPNAGQGTNVVFFNGNDALGLFKVEGNDTILIDAIGEPNNNPGSGWEVAGITNATSDHTLVRESTITMGNTNWAASAGTNATDSEWEVYDQDDLSYIGWHINPPTGIQISNVAIDPTNPTDEDAVSVSADIVDVAKSVSSAKVMWGLTSGSLTNEITMSNSTGDAWVTDTDILAQAVGATVYYRVWAQNDGGDKDSTNEMSYVVSSSGSVSIYDIQYTTDPSGDSPLVGQTVTTTGIVTAVKGDKSFFLQEGDGAWNGVFVYQPDVQVAVGDDVTITAEVVEYNGLTELSNATDVTINSSGNTLPSATSILTGDMAEDYEGVLIDIDGANCINTDAGYGMWTILNGTTQSDSLLVDDDLYSDTVYINHTYNVTGVGHYSFGAYKILPREAADIEDITTGTEPVISNVATDPANPTADDAVSVTAEVTDDGTVEAVKLYWGTDASSITNEIAMSVQSGDVYVTDADIPAQATGTTVYYYVKATDDEGLVAESDVADYTTIGVNEVAGTTVAMYPNPANAKVTVEIGAKAEYVINIYSVVGELVYTNEFNSAVKVIDVDNFQKGMYQVQVINASTKQASMSKLIVK